MKKFNLPKLSKLPMDKLINFHSRWVWGVKDANKFDELINELKKILHPGYYIGDHFMDK